MLHDQGHIPVKLTGRRSAAVAIGTPVLFSSAAHGIAVDIAGKDIAGKDIAGKGIAGKGIAGKGIVDPAALIAAIGVLTGHPV
jgi:isocitrate/isopropylmalate dehydrogenase